VPTKKQRRRQEKSRRHEWEYVYVDDEGHEVEVDADELSSKKREKDTKPARPAAAGATDARGRRMRTIEPPSWRRVFKRAAIFAPIFVAVLLVLNREGSIYARVGAAIPLLLVFIPFSYFTDRLAYRTYQRRLERVQAQPKPAKPKSRAKAS
jgi:hypothetical protein